MGFVVLHMEKGARQRQRNDRTYRAFHHTEERRPHTHAPEPQAHRIPRRSERPFGGYTAEIGRSWADTQNRKQPSTGNPHQRIGNAQGHEADRGRGRLDEWCADNLKYFADTFGKENIVAAHLHRDEETPHIHVTLVPIVKGRA